MKETKAHELIISISIAPRNFRNVSKSSGIHSVYTAIPSSIKYVANILLCGRLKLTMCTRKLPFFIQIVKASC